MNDTNKYCTMYIVRHGQSVANVNEVYGLDTPLTEKGREQAKQIAKNFRPIHFDEIFSSPLARAKETAQIIAKEHQIIVLTKEALHERLEGKLEGRTYTEVRKKLKDVYASRYTLPYADWSKVSLAEGYETDEKLMQRFINELREIAVAYPDKTVLIASHLGLMKTLLIHLGLHTHITLRGKSFDNTGYIKLRTDGIDFIVEETAGIKENVK